VGGEFSDYIVYVDESGDHGLDSIDPGYPVFVLAFCIFQKSEYLEEIAPRIQQFKFRHFVKDIVILHEVDIRKDRGDFKFLKEPGLKRAFIGELTEIIESSPFTLICVVIDKRKLRGNYRFPANPYHIALKYGLERVFAFLAKKGQDRRLAHIVVESRGKREDRELELEFLRVAGGGNYRNARLPFELVFADKKSNSAGLQLADLFAHPVGMSVWKPAQGNRASEVLKAKFDRDTSGEIRGRGLKVFPE